jgi:polyisoprenoid-binding protein YceI
MLDMNAQSFYDIERSAISTRNNNNLIEKSNPVQNSFQNNYHTMQFDNQTNDNNQEVNKFLTRNPVNTKRDDLEKTRNLERQNFLKVQGGPLINFNDLRVENTRKGRNEINSSSYVPMPKTLAVPTNNI